LGLPHHLAGLRVAVSLRDPRFVLAVDEAVFLDAAQRHLDHAVSVLSDDRLLGDDVRDVLADRFAHLLPMPEPVSGRTVTPLGVGMAVRAEDRIHGDGFRSEGSRAERLEHGRSRRAGRKYTSTPSRSHAARGTGPRLVGATPSVCPQTGGPST